MKTKSNHLSKLIVAFLMFASTSFSQNITNTLGTNGFFTIKDASKDYLTLDQSTGHIHILKSLRIENTSGSGVGVLYKGGQRFLHNYGGGDNTFLGNISGNFTMTGSNNTGLGSGTLTSNTTGTHNIAVGTYSLFSNTDGLQNTAMGWGTLYSNTTGIGNTAIGYQSMYFNATGDHNTVLGFVAGTSVTTGNNLTCIGNNAEPTSGAANNQITLGNNAVTSLRCNVQTITSLSDARDKKNISDLSLGLDFLMKIKPRLFNWDKREWYESNISDGSKMNEAPTAGFIAQELDEVQTTENAEWLNLVLKDNPEKMEASYGNLLPVMVKAIQELKAENDLLKQNNETLSAQVDAFKSVTEKLVTLEQKVNELTSVKQTSFSENNQTNKISNGGEIK